MNKKLKYAGWGLTEEAKGKVIAREVKKKVPMFNRYIKYVQLRHLGYNNAEIAKRNHVSRERARQILSEFDETFILLD